MLEKTIFGTRNFKTALIIPTVYEEICVDSLTGIGFRFLH